MAFTFLHAADLHLGSPFTGLAQKDAAVAKQIADASRNSFTSLVSVAVEKKVSFMVIAGDIYDGEWKDTSIGLFFNREVAKLERAGIPLYLLKGNHDADSVVTKTISLPASVFQFSTSKVEPFEIKDLKVVLYGRSFPVRAVTENYAITYPPYRPGWFNIGVLHTSCTGSPQHDSYAPCSISDLQTRGYQYWALGHVHEYAILCEDPWIVFPGNLQGRNVRECGPKGAVIVTVEDGHVKDVNRVIVDQARWANIAVDVTGVADELALLLKIEAAIGEEVDAAQGRLLAVRVSLEGKTELHQWLKSENRHFTDQTQASAHRCHADVWLERLKVNTTEIDAPATNQNDSVSSLDLRSMLDALEFDPEVREAAAAIIRSITAKLPAGIATGEIALADQLDNLLEDAKSTVLDRVADRKGMLTQCAS